MIDLPLPNARLDAWIHVTVVFISEERIIESEDRQKRMQTKHQHALSKHLPLSVQQILQSARSVLFRVKDVEFLRMMGVQSSNEAQFSNFLQGCTKFCAHDRHEQVLRSSYTKVGKGEYLM